MDLSSTYLGLSLRNPLVAAASPLSQTVAGVQRLAAGADVVMTASALLRHGPGHARVLLDGLAARMDRKGFTAVRDLRGLLAVPPGADGAAHERSGYVSTVRAATERYGP
jgi:dihydroorotate dehydrogenase (fumarate)